MLKVLVVDDSQCKQELEEFLGKHKGAVKSLAALHDGNSYSPLPEMAGGLNFSGNCRIAVNTNNSLILLRVHEIIRCEGDRNYTNIYMAGDTRYTVSRTLLEFDEILGRHGFIRIHKSHLVNLNYLEKYIKADGGQAELSNGLRLPVSIRRKDQLFKELSKRSTWI